MSEVYAIMNLERFAAYVREKAALEFTKECDEDLDEFVSIPQTCFMIEECSVGKDENGRLLLEENGRELLSELLRVRIYNMGLAKLAAGGHLECAWDNESNEMIFWRDSTLP